MKSNAIKAAKLLAASFLAVGCLHGVLALLLPEGDQGPVSCPVTEQEAQMLAKHPGFSIERTRNFVRVGGGCK
jgi:hypothetical protein